jgi:hypothetical protein
MSSETRITCQDLRRFWKPTKERLQAIDRSHPTVVRVHRSLSWLARVEDDQLEPDFVLLCRWIALNSLYGAWNPAAGQVIGHQESLRLFLDRIIELDQDGRLNAVLTEHKRLALALLEDKYLIGYFWERSETLGGRPNRDRHRAQGWYVEGRWLVILESVLERIYLLRCQLVHGAATFGGKLNRTAVSGSSTMLGPLVPAILEVVVLHGADEDWGSMCYPPVHGSLGSLPVRVVGPR